MKLLAVVGARPQFIKDAAIRRAIDTHNAHTDAERIERMLVHTGQHYDTNMSQVFFDELSIEAPAYNLDVGSGAHGAQTGLMLQRLEPIMQAYKPDCVLVYGDTNSTLAAALVAAKMAIAVVHVEAGLRSHNTYQPEEINRRLTDHVSALLLCPTHRAITQLQAEGLTTNAFWTGDVMYDCALFYGAKAQKLENALLRKHGLKPKGFGLATVHRAENTDYKARLNEIMQALGKASTANHPMVLPLHPRTRVRLERFDLALPSSLKVISPVSYLEMVVLERNASVIATDSGGVQKEAYFHGVPCVTLRNETEWTETIDAGWNQLVGADGKAIIAAIEAAKPGRPITEYGQGEAATQVVRHIIEHFGQPASAT